MMHLLRQRAPKGRGLPVLTCSDMLVKAPTPARQRSCLQCSFSSRPARGSMVKSRATMVGAEGADEAEDWSELPLHPSETTLELWQAADAVILNVDCTITKNDTLDLLGAWMGIKDEVEELSKKAADGTMNLTDAMEERLARLNCSPQDIKNFMLAHPPKNRLVPGVEEHIMALRTRGIEIFLVSGGFREVALPIAEHLGIPSKNVFSNSMCWDLDSKHINENHENPIYLPGANLGENVIANNNLIETVQGADLIIFCAPHQFMHGICKQLAAAKVVNRGAKAISLTKGMHVRAEGPQLISQMVSRILGIDCSVLMGANIAGDIAKEELSEAVIAYTSRDAGALWQQLFQRPYFAISLLPDVPGAEMCGTLKNIVAVGAGMGDGLGIGPNSKASILRQGLSEMRQFCKYIYPSVRDDTFFESCGVGDVIASSYDCDAQLCFRHVPALHVCAHVRLPTLLRVAEAWCQRRMAGNTMVSFDDLEKEMLNGQKLQGVLTSDEVQEVLETRGWELDFPLFTTINRIIHGEVPPNMILRCCWMRYQ
ncbi:NAD-dependent glycerol-3-phosphate dehydrogenase N-terminus-domain-containing protein, partial [Dunaliella salina]